MIVLPRGLFIFKSPSNIMSKNVNNLVDICSQLGRKIDIISDFSIDENLINPKWVNITKIEEVKDKYDYIVVADHEKMSYNHFNDCREYRKDISWMGYMLPFGSKAIQYNDTTTLRNQIKNAGYDAIVIPNVKNMIGSNIFVLFNQLQGDNNRTVTQVNAGNNMFIWGNIFRACGFFNIQSKWEQHEL